MTVWYSTTRLSASVALSPLTSPLSGCSIRTKRRYWIFCSTTVPGPKISSTFCVANIRSTSASAFRGMSAWAEAEPVSASRSSSSASTSANNLCNSPSVIERPRRELFGLPLSESSSSLEPGPHATSWRHTCFFRPLPAACMMQHPRKPQKPSSPATPANSNRRAVVLAVRFSVASD